MSRKRVFIFVFVCISIAMLLLGFTGCGKKVDPSKIATIFLIKAEENNFYYVPIQRALSEKELQEEKLKVSIKLLLDGPTEAESQDNLSSEVPEGTRLVSYRDLPRYIEVNLSGQFVSGGGSESMKARIKQLYKTIEFVTPDKSVLLLIDGKQIQNIGGEGYIFNNPIYNADDEIPIDISNTPSESTS